MESRFVQPTPEPVVARIRVDHSYSLSSRMRVIRDFQRLAEEIGLGLKVRVTPGLMANVLDDVFSHANAVIENGSATIQAPNLVGRLAMRTLAKCLNGSVSDFASMHTETIRVLDAFVQLAERAPSPFLRSLREDSP